jgi:hypothetical protein
MIPFAGSKYIKRIPLVLVTKSIDKIKETGWLLVERSIMYKCSAYLTD